MIDFALVCVIIALLVLIGWQEYQNRQERNKWINALMSKDANQLRDLEIVAKLPEQQPEGQPDLIRVEDLSDEDFNEMIQKEVANG